MRLIALFSAALLTAAASTSAFAHASLEEPVAAPGAYKAVVKIPHGCDGQATHTVRIDLPEGFIAAKPMPKAGWQLETETGDYAEAYSLHGDEVAAGVTAVTWSGGALEDGHYDEFVVAGTLSGIKDGAVLAFKTTQLCADGEVVWDEIAEAGQDPHDLEFPVPTLTVAAGDDPHNGHEAHGGDAAQAGEIAIGELTISGAWARATLPNQTVGGGYMTIENAGEEDDRLISVAAPITERAEIHQMAVTDEVMTMRRLEDGLAIPAGESVTLAPGGLHLMFQDLAAPIVEGETVEVTLTFDKAGAVTVALPVQPAGARVGGGSEGGGDHQH